MISKFLRDDCGAVTIDWVGLTAGILLLGVAVVYGIFTGGVLPLSQEINSNLSTAVQVPADAETAPSGFSSTGL